MPEIDGVQVLETLQSQGVALPIIVMTADVQEWLKARCIELGATVFLNKPVKQDVLRATLKEMLKPLQSLESPCA